MSWFIQVYLIGVGVSLMWSLIQEERGLIEFDSFTVIFIVLWPVYAAWVLAVSLLATVLLIQTWWRNWHQPPA